MNQCYHNKKQTEKSVNSKSGKFLEHKDVQARVSLAIRVMTSSHITSGNLYCTPTRREWKRQIAS